MQINGTLSGPTMAASEPPEPPPRNPDRINASLHKLSESKAVKSLDSSSSATIPEKSLNNNKPLKTILSLDSNTATTAAATTTTAATTIITAAVVATTTAIASSSAAGAVTAAAAAATVTGTGTGSGTAAAATLASAIATTATASLVASGKGTAVATTTAIAAAAAVATPSALIFHKRADIGQPGGECSTPLSSNGSNHTLISPMTIDNQLQQQQQQHQQRLSFLSKGDSHCQLMPQQQQQQNGTTPRVAALLINEQQQQQQQQQQAAQQLINGCINSMSSSISNTSSSSKSSSGNGTTALNANNSNAIAANHINLQATTAVDKRNANDVCSIVKLMDFGTISTSKTIPTIPATTTPTAEVAAVAARAECGAIGAGLLLSTATSKMATTPSMGLKSCDSNRNNDDDADNHDHDHHSHSDSPTKLREENERLSAEIVRLRKLLENSPEGAVGGIDLSDSNSCGDAQSTDGSGGTPQQRVDRLEAELRSAKTQIMTLRIERKKLRSDKSELLSQVKQLCASLQDKEQELRDFIRNYQERVRATESNNAKLTGDRERERWQLLKQARDEAERSLALAQQLNARDMQLQRLQEQLQEARRQISGCLSDQESLLSFAPLTPPSAASGLLNQMAAAAAGGLRTEDSGRGNSLSAFSSSLSGGSGATVGDRNSCSNDSGLRNNSDRESTGGDLNFSDGACDNGPCITVDPDSISLVSRENMYQYGTPKDRSPTLSPLNSAAYSRSVEQLGSPVDPEGPGAVSRKFTAKTGTLGARNGRGGTWGSISRVFARSRNKNKAMSADGAAEYSDYSWSPLSEEGYAEKLRLLREASQLPMERWRATQVLAWLEVALGMPQYSTRCAENVKSGKVLLELNDAELEAGLGLTHPMHRKKLRLAIEEQRRPELVRYPMITQLGHTWVASEWLPDIGLPQYAESFLHSLVDARMLDTLSKKELEKFLGVTRKFHQASIVHGIHVLRIVKYDRQTLAMRRVQSESVDTDPIVWTNQRFIRWAKSIDLGEYADNLKDSGVHGGLVVLEPSFSGDTMATALGIPPSKNIIRRHLTTEFDTLILPARATLGQGIRSGCGGIVPITGPGGLQHYATTDRRSNSALRISAWKGSQSSLSKTFRFNAKPSRSGSSIGDRTSFGNSTSPTPSYSSSEGGGGIYATIGPPPHFPPPTTAPPPPPAQAPLSNYGPPGHRVSAPPVGSIMESLTDPSLLYEQHRRVKSISDIGVGATGSSDSPI